MTSLDHSARLRLAALNWCEEQRRRWGDHVPVRALSPFPFEGELVHLKGQQGIFKPRQLEDGPLSIRTALDSPYNDDVLGGGDTIRYDYAPETREGENRGLERLAGTGTPLIYLVQVADKSRGVEYLVVSPVFVAAFDRSARVFTIELSGALRRPELVAEVEPGAEESLLVSGGVDVGPIAREYRIQQVQARLHQAHFRRRVLEAYRQRCTICELRVRPLLDAAHIVPDAQGGEAAVTNGLGLCALHHRALDRGIVRVRPDYTVEVDGSLITRRDAMAERTLLAFDGERIALPRDRAAWPSVEGLERRGA